MLVICVRSDYILLREHFKTAHVLCEEGECRDAEFTNAFRSDIDYRAHWTQKHSAGVGRQQARQMRQIGISVDFGSSDGATAGGDARNQRGSHQRGLLLTWRYRKIGKSMRVAGVIGESIGKFIKVWQKMLKRRTSTHVEKVMYFASSVLCPNVPHKSVPSPV